MFVCFFKQMMMMTIMTLRFDSLDKSIIYSRFNLSTKKQMHE